MGGEQLAGHPPAQLALLGVGGVVAGLGQRPAGRAPVHVDVLHADQPGPGGLGGGQHAGLQGGELLGPAGVGRVEGLVDDAGAWATAVVKPGSRGVAADDLDVVGNAGGAGAVDHPDASRRGGAERRGWPGR